MMSELRKLFLLTDKTDIRLRTQYIRSAANILADKLSRETDTSDIPLAKRVSHHLDYTYPKHTIDWFASKKKTSSYNTATRSGETAKPRRWTPYISRTRRGEKR
jgi:hypothetical protein